MIHEVEFTAEQKVVGYVETHSGSVALMDGIVEAEISLSPQGYVALDVNLERKRIPVIATVQGGRRYLLLALDAAENISGTPAETVDTEGQVEIPEEKTDDEG